MTRKATVELHKEELSFSAGHFTIFSATDREDLHGHNYHIHAAFEVEIKDNGLAFDYRHYKKKLLELAQRLDRKFLLPERSKHLTVEDTGDMLLAHFDTEKIPFLRRDVVILPLTNITIEELSHWFLQEMLRNKEDLDRHNIQKIMIRVFNGPGQSGGAEWSRE